MYVEIGNLKLSLRLEIDPEKGDVYLIANETVGLCYIDRQSGKLFRAHIPEHAVITVRPLPIKGGYIEIEDELPNNWAVVRQPVVADSATTQNVDVANHVENETNEI